MPSTTTIPSSQAEPPDYADFLAALHEVQDPLFSQIVADLPLVQAARVLDVGSGDGYFLRKLRARLDGQGVAVGLDLDRAYLERAAQSLEHDRRPALLVRGSATDLPFCDDAFDLTFSAMSFFDFTEPRRVIEEMARVTRPGGKLAIIEQDIAHRSALPLPPELELAVIGSMHEEARRAEGSSSRFFAARMLPEWLADAGVVDIERRCFSHDLIHPLSAAEQRCVELMIDELLELTGEHLTKAQREALEAWRRGRSCAPGPDQEGFAASLFYFLVTATVQ